MDSNYHIFKKTVQSGKKSTHKWYCYWNDPVTGKMFQKVCKNCRTQAEAYAFVSSLPPIFAEKKYNISDIAQWMYIPGGPHIERLAKLGRVYDLKTLKTKRNQLNVFLEKFGQMELKDLTVPEVVSFLAEDEHSGSWKNNLLTVIGEVYDEAPYTNAGYVQKITFPKFKRNTKKKDIFTTEELNILFNENLWKALSKQMYEKQPQFDEGYEAIYLMFLCAASCGLRLGEAIGIRTSQFLFDQHMLLVDGFFKNDEKERTNFNKCGSEEDRKLRVVPLPETVAAMVKKFILERNIGPEDFVFLRYGHPIRKCLAEKWFERAVLLSGIEIGGRKLTPHSLRYTYITRMRRDVGGEIVQKLAGHSSLAMTDYYTRAAIPELVAGAMPAVEAANRLFE